MRQSGRCAPNRGGRAIGQSRHQSPAPLMLSLALAIGPHGRRSRTGKLVMGILALIAEFENDIRRERQLDGIAKARSEASRRSTQAR